MPVASCPCHWVVSLAPSPSHPLFIGLHMVVRSPEFFSSGLSPSSQPFLKGQMLQSLHHLPLIPHPSFNGKSSTSTRPSTPGLASQCRTGGKNHPDLLAMLSLMQPRTLGYLCWQDTLVATVQFVATRTSETSVLQSCFPVSQLPSAEVPGVSIPFIATCAELHEVPLCPHSQVVYQPLFPVFIQFAICTVAEDAVHPTIQLSNEEVRPQAQTKRKISSPQPKPKLSINAPEHPVHRFPSKLSFTTLTCSGVERPHNTSPGGIKRSL